MAESAPLHFVSGDKELSTKAQAEWSPMKKKPGSVVLMKRIGEPFTVDTEEGKLAGTEEDYLAHDPATGHFWPVKAEYAALHYEDASQVNPDYAVAKDTETEKATNGLISHIYEESTTHLDGSKEVVLAQVTSLLKGYFDSLPEGGHANIKLTTFRNATIEIESE